MNVGCLIEKARFPVGYDAMFPAGDGRQLRRNDTKAGTAGS
jgi:hypothetical protein